MKRSVIIFLFGIPGVLGAQHRLETRLNMFIPEDVIVKQQVSYKDPGRPGRSVLWDFSRLSVEDESYELAYFPGYNGTVSGTEHQTRYLYRLSGDSLLLLGFSTQGTQMKNRQPELLLRFPVHYGDTVTSYFYAHGKHGNRLEMDAMGISETTADAWGRMVLPDGDTLKQVLRTRTLKYIARDMKPISPEYYRKDTAQFSISSDSIRYRLSTDSVILAEEIFRWYEKGYRYPVFETVRSWEQYAGNREAPYENTAFFYPPQEQYYLNDDEENPVEPENPGDSTVDPWADLTYNVYPNPVRTLLEVELYLPRPARVRLQLRSTTGLIYRDEDRGFFTEGISRFQTDLSALPTDNYVLNIRLDDYTVSEIILKR